MKASAFRRWPVAGAYSPEQTTRLTGGSDLRHYIRQTGVIGQNVLMKTALQLEK